MRTTLPKLVRTLVNFLCLNAVILSAACSQVTFGSTQPTLHPTNADQPKIKEEGNITITFAADEYQRNLYEPLIEEFNLQNPGIRVQFVPLPQPEPGELQGEADWIRMLASSGDTTLTYGVWMVGSSRSAYFRDLDPLIDTNPAFDSDDFWPGALDACGDHDEHTIGIPLLTNIRG